jgi:hypothetical protein
MVAVGRENELPRIGARKKLQILRKLLLKLREPELACESSNGAPANFPGLEDLAVVIHPNTEVRFVNDTIGYGVVATRFIPKGTITWVRDRFDMVFTPGQVGQMRRSYRDILDKYAFVDRHGMYVLCWDIGRFVNHSCNASCLSPGYDFEIAIRDLHPGDELTDDYGSLNLDTVFQCHCGHPRCRKRIMPDDFIHYGDDWDTRLGDAFPQIADVEQPLWWVVEDHPDRLEVEAAIRGRVPVISCRAHYARVREAPPLVAVGH